jgi:hypothetical protein
MNDANSLHPVGTRVPLKELFRKSGDCAANASQIAPVFFDKIVTSLRALKMQRRRACAAPRNYGS